MIRINNLSKSYGKKILFEDVSFNINPGEKIGLLGRNGSGKTTLFRIIMGEEPYDSGEIEVARGFTVGHVKQNLVFSKRNIIEECSVPMYDQNELIEEWKVKKMLAGLGFSEADFEKSPRELSGGFQVRLNLARGLLSEPGIMLLDEPTNYLDISSIRWLINFLRNWDKTILLITHDRGFMDQIVTHTAIIHRSHFRKIKGDTEKMYERIAQDEEVYEKTRINDEKKQKEMEVFINRFRAKARLAGMVQSRVKQLEKTEKKEKLAKIKNLEFSFAESPFEAKTLLNVSDLKFGYDSENILIDGLSFSVNYGDRIGIIGRNGKGKSTLMKLLSGEERPLAGEILYHGKASYGFFSQTNISVLEDNRTVEDEIASTIGNTDRQKSRNICGAMLFEGDDALKKISVLSGGEKARVLVGKILIRPVNMLLLDEPTNHFDMESCDSLLQALDSFSGAVMIVTHNELFLNALTNKLIVFQGGKTMFFNGSYPEFLERVGWYDESSEEGGVSVEGKKVTKKDIRKIRSEFYTRRAKTMKPLEEGIAKMEEAITDGEKSILEIQDLLIQASQDNASEKIADLSKRYSFLRQMIDETYEKLDVVITEKDKMDRLFQEELSGIEKYESTDID